MSEQEKDKEKEKEKTKHEGITERAPSDTKLVAPALPGKVRLVKMVIMRDTEVMMPGSTQPVVKKKGDIVDLEESEAVRLTQKVFRGTYGFTGERDGIVQKQLLRAAVPWQPSTKQLKDKDPLNPLNFQESVV